MSRTLKWVLLGHGTTSLPSYLITYYAIYVVSSKTLTRITHYSVETMFFIHKFSDKACKKRPVLLFLTISRIIGLLILKEFRKINTLTILKSSNNSEKKWKKTSNDLIKYLYLLIKNILMENTNNDNHKTRDGQIGNTHVIFCTGLHNMYKQNYYMHICNINKPSSNIHYEQNNITQYQLSSAILSIVSVRRFTFCL